MSKGKGRCLDYVPPKGSGYVYEGEGFLYMFNVSRKELSKVKIHIFSKMLGMSKIYLCRDGRDNRIRPISRKEGVIEKYKMWTFAENDPEYEDVLKMFEDVVYNLINKYEDDIEDIHEKVEGLRLWISDPNINIVEFPLEVGVV